jgi:hypothetical protein
VTDSNVKDKASLDIQEYDNPQYEERVGIKEVLGNVSKFRFLDYFYMSNRQLCDTCLKNRPNDVVYYDPQTHRGIATPMRQYYNLFNVGEPPKPLTKKKVTKKKTSDDSKESKKKTTKKPVAKKTSKKSEEKQVANLFDISVKSTAPENNIKNSDFNVYIKNLIQSRQVNMFAFDNKPMMYFFLTNMNDPENKDRVLCKIGYSSDFCKRKKELEDTFTCDFTPIACKLVSSDKIEKNLHKLLKLHYSEFHIPIKAKKKTYKEFYVFDEKLLKEFDSFNN